MSWLETEATFVLFSLGEKERSSFELFLGALGALGVSAVPKEAADR